jgi:ABC-type nitrate/sulfonate/bicarbonate transport system ATPase subunit
LIVIEVIDLSVGYGRTLVVENVSFTVRQGGCIGLLGRSGCGKTTVLHAIAGLLPIAGGCVRVDGAKSEPGSIRGIVFQEIALLGWRTVLENVCFPGRGSDVEGRGADAEELLTILGLKEYLSRFPHELSTGMRRRVEFARALLLDDRYLAADEPFSSLDVWTRQLVWEWFRRFQACFERTTVLTTHSPEEAMFLCDQVIVLSHRHPSRVARHIRIPCQWPLEEVLNRTDLETRRIFAEIMDSLRENSAE